jgi:hypothetical protein
MPEIKLDVVGGELGVDLAPSGRVNPESRAGRDAPFASRLRRPEA